ncbi:MAG: hypothetical protein IKI30_03810 [Oxalobacter sp.]|nr:hypothetical protein [Oxalobacter sp.]
MEITNEVFDAIKENPRAAETAQGKAITNGNSTRKQNRKTKTSQVLVWLLTYGSITSWEAIEKFKATRLADIIYRLRKAHNIIREDVRCEDVNGNPCVYGRYHLIKSDI